jgi:hypothetical protein
LKLHSDGSLLVAKKRKYETVASSGNHFFAKIFRRGSGLHTWANNGPIKRLKYSTNERIAMVVRLNFDARKMHTSRILPRKEFSLAGLTFLRKKENKSF